MSFTKISIETVKEFLPKGSTKPFVALSDSDKQYVVKALKLTSKNGRQLLNEFVAGVLANRINLPWPKTSLAILSDQSIECLKNESFNIRVLDCVALEFIEGLTAVPLAEIEPSKRNVIIELQEANPKHLAQYFINPRTQSAFYGRALFELWLFFTDTKSDTLHAKPDKTPIFLDGSHALEGEEFELCNLDYSSNASFPSSPYLEGILTHTNLFDEWLNRIELIEDSFVRSMIDSIPTSWGIPDKQLKCLYDLLTVRKKEFLVTARQIIDWECTTRS